MSGKISHYNEKDASKIVDMFKDNNPDSEFYNPIFGALKGDLVYNERLGIIYPKGTIVRVDFEYANPEDVFYVEVTVKDRDRAVKSFMECQVNDTLAKGIEFIQEGIDIVSCEVGEKAFKK